MNVFAPADKHPAAPVAKNTNQAGNTATASRLADNRPEAVAQRKLQANMPSRQAIQDNRPAQKIADNRTATQTLQRKPNRTGLPDQLKSGVESLSGLSMDDVRVHYNSPRPAQLQAHAYAQGTDIHLAPGQEKHLPHEAWHVVQQKQGRVRPTLQMKGNVPVNDNAGLEREADVMGARAMGVKDVPLQMHKHALDKTYTVVQLGRKGEIGGNKYFIKLVLPGSGDKHWRTRTHEQIDNMETKDSDIKQLHWFRPEKKEHSIAGPQAGGGVSDTGPNSIANNIPLGIKLMENAVSTAVLDGENPANIVILIKAHSRNAVAASQISKGLTVNFERRYPGHRPAIEVVMFDPVPGPGHSGELVNTDVGFVSNSTLVYSLHTQHPVGFTPQKVTGAKRLIISRQDHGVGTTSAFSYGGREYKGSNLSSLPEGVFVGGGIVIAPDNPRRAIETIYRITSETELIHALQASTFHTQSDRLVIIEDVAKTFHLTPARAPRERIEEKEKID
jgi:hypothetical protein